ncbi:MAG TPA: response regulator [Gallionellaceae bacterium]|nr:response regulator [Gallionellaceae bacterium]
MKSYRILLLDDDDFILAALRRELMNQPYVGHEGLEIEAFDSSAAALARAREPEGYFDVVIADNRMPEMSGIDFLKAFRKIQPDAARIVLSGHADMKDMVRAINEAHIDFFIAKPWHEYDLKNVLWQAFRDCDLRYENRRLAREYLDRFGLHHQMKRKDKYQLMIVDDDSHVLHALERELDESYSQGAFGLYQLEAHAFEHVDEAFRAARERPFDVIICDYAMPGMNGIEFLRQFKEAQPDAVRILISGKADVNVLVEAVNRAGVSCFVDKPWRDYELRAAIDRALTHRELELDNRILADLLRLRTRH